MTSFSLGDLNVPRGTNLQTVSLGRGRPAHTRMSCLSLKKTVSLRSVEPISSYY